MSQQKISISISEDLLNFVQYYQQVQHLEHRSQVIELAIKKMQEEYLKQAYIEMNAEIDFDELDATVNDGLNHETW